MIYFYMWSKYLFLLKKYELRHPLSSVSIGSDKSKNARVVVLIMRSYSLLVVCNNVNPCVEGFCPAEATIPVLELQFTKYSLKSMLDGDRFLPLPHTLNRFIMNYSVVS